MLASTELNRALSPDLHAPRCAGFIPHTVRPPDHFLSGLAALRAGLRNPIELWDREIFSLPSREIRRFGGQRFLEITDPGLMRQVLVQEGDAFRRSEFQLRFTRPLVGTGILAAEGERWKAQRRAAAPAFRHQAVEALIPAAAAAGERAAASLKQSRSAVDIVPLMMSATFDIVTELLGVEAGLLDQAAIDTACNDYLKGVGLGAIADIFGLGWLHRCLPLRSKRAVATIKREAARAVALARTSGDKTRLLARLAEAFGRDEEDASLRDSVIAFIAAGHETGAVGLSWALHLVANDPLVQKRLGAEARRVLGTDAVTASTIGALDLHLRVIKEALRLFPPITLMQRTATRDVVIGDHHLSAGDEVVCAIYVMHRSERLWEKPDVFDPDRFTPERSEGRHRFAYMPFGAGVHACIGMPLALAEMVAILATLTRSLRFESEAPESVLPVMRLTLRPYPGVRLVARVRRQQAD